MPYSRNPIVNALVPHIMQMESGGNPRAVSPVGAQGLMQLMPDTAKRFGVSNPFDPKQNIMGGTKYLEYLAKRYNNDPELIAGSYHAGEGNMDNYLAGIRSGVGKKTRAYMADALKRIGYEGSQGDLKNAGFEGYQQRPQANIDKFPITPIQGVEPQSTVVEAKSMPVVNNLVDFAKEQKGINHSKLMAQALAGAFDGYDPNAQISGRAIEMHPITALAKALQTGFGAYEGSRAIAKESDLEAKKASVLQDMMNSGSPIDQNALLASGLVSPDKIAEALVKKQQQAEYNAVYGDNGEIMAFDKSTGKVSPTGQKSAIYAPDSVYNRSLASSAGKGVGMTDDNGRPYYVPQGQTNPAFGSYGQGQARLDQPTGLMPVPNSAPLPVPNSTPIVKGASPIDLKRQEAEAMIAPKVQEAQAVGAVKYAQDVDLAKEKAVIENQQKIDQQVNTQTQGAKKGLGTLDSMMKYLYPGGQPVRDASGRLAPPTDAMLLGNSPIDRATMLGHQYGMHNDKASNLTGLRRLVGSLVMDANNGSLGAGVSNADVEFLKRLQGVTDSAQDPKDIYNAIADNEDKFNRIMGAAKSPNSDSPIDPKRAELEQLRKELMQ